MEEMYSLTTPTVFWAALGIVLFIAEMLTFTFYILGFSLGALFVAFLYLLFTPSFSLALFLFSISSVLFTVLLRKKFVFNRKKDNPVGQSKDGTIGTRGTMTQEVSATQKGTVEFPVALMGSREWTALSDEHILPGTTVYVQSIEGNYLKVGTREPKEIASAHMHT